MSLFSVKKYIQLLCAVSAEILYNFNKRSLSKYKLDEISHEQSEILLFAGLLLHKSYKVSTKKVQKSCLSWHWRVMRSLKKNWLVVSLSSLTWRIWWIFIRSFKSQMAWRIGSTFITALKSLKNCTLTGSFCPKRIFHRGYICVMTLKGDAKFKEKLTCGLRNDIRNLHFDWILLSKAGKYLDEKIQKSYVSWHWRWFMIIMFHDLTM